MLTDLELAQMQQTAGEALPDDLTISLPSDTGTLDPITGIWTPDPATIILSGQRNGRVRTPSAEEIVVFFGDTQVTKTRYVVTLRSDAPDTPIDAIVKVDRSSDLHIHLRSFRITRRPSGSYLINRRLGAETVE